MAMDGHTLLKSLVANPSEPLVRLDHNNWENLSDLPVVGRCSICGDSEGRPLPQERKQVFKFIYQEWHFFTNACDLCSETLGSLKELLGKSERIVGAIKAVVDLKRKLIGPEPGEIVELKVERDVDASGNTDPVAPPPEVEGVDEVEVPPPSPEDQNVDVESGALASPSEEENIASQDVETPTLSPQDHLDSDVESSLPDASQFVTAQLGEVSASSSEPLAITEPNLNCGKCGKLMAHMNSLRRHLEYCGIPVEKRGHNCRVCNQFYSKHFSLQRHMQMMHGKVLKKPKKARKPRVIISTRKTRAEVLQKKARELGTGDRILKKRIPVRARGSNPVAPPPVPNEAIVKQEEDDDDEIEVPAPSPEDFSNSEDQNVDVDVGIVSAPNEIVAYPEEHNLGVDESIAPDPSRFVTVVYAQEEGEFGETSASSGETLAIKDKSPRTRKLNCGKCGKRFSWKNSLRLHVQICGIPVRKRGQQCRKCHHYFASHDTLQRHGKFCKGTIKVIPSIKKPIKKPSNERKKFNCEICNYGINTKNHFFRHLETHDPNRRLEHVCSICNRSLSSKSSLNSHMQNFHSGERKVWRCPHCAFKTESKHSLTWHKSKHGWSRDELECYFCGKILVTPYNLRDHMRSKHLLEK